MIGTADIREHVKNSITLRPSEHLSHLLTGADDWAIAFETAHLLTSLVEYAKPGSVLEFGAGYSSLVIAAALHGNGGGRLTSIEHQPEFARPRWRELSQFSSVDAKLVHASLSLRFSKHGLMHEYGGVEKDLECRGPFELVFVDAPPGHLGRDATLLTAAPFLSPGALIILDDWVRPSEQTTVRRWMRALEVEEVYQSATFARGISVLRAKGPSNAAFSLRTFAGTVHDRLIHG